MTKGRPVVIHLLNISLRTAHSCGQNAGAHHDSRLFQKFDPSSLVTRVHVNRSNDNLLDASLHDLINAGAGPTRCGTRFQRHVQYRSCRDRAGDLLEAFNLRVRRACLAMMAAGDNLVPGNEHSADSRIRACPLEPPSRFSATPRA